MKRIGSYWSLVLFALGAVVLVPDCVIKATTTDDCVPGSTLFCTCSGGGSGERTCNAAGNGYGSCVCTGSSTSSSSTTTSATGSSTSGSATVGATVGVGGASVSTSGTSSTTSSSSTGGAGGTTGTGGSSGTGGTTDAGSRDAATDSGSEGGTGIDACDSCMVMQCAKEFDDCFDDPMCFSGDPSAPGQYELVVECVEQKRTMQDVKRIDFRTCGQIVGTGIDWPPPGMTEATTNIMNCMATGQTMIPMNNSWASNANITQVWPPNSCAKLACTSRIQ